MVKFVKYTGKWPCLCQGVLVLEINGKRYIFNGRLVGSRLEQSGFDYPRFWESGGSCGWDVTQVEEGPWIIEQKKLPEELRHMADEIARVFNANVTFGCCGGCT